MQLQGKTVLITGASGSIGQALVRTFAEAGAKVAIHYHANQEAAEQLRTELGGEGHLCLSANMAHPHEIERMVDEAVRSWGKLDILVNNAAIYVQHPVESVS